MKKSIKILIIVAVSLLVAGAIVMTIGFATTGFSFNNLSGYEETTHTVEQPFECIKISEIDMDVRIVLSNDEAVKIKTYDREKLKLNVSVEDGALKLTRIDEKKWYEFIGVNFGISNHVITTLYLPAGEYKELTVKTLSGDVSLTKDLSFTSVSVDTLSGDVSGSVNSKGKIGIETVSGDVDLFDLNESTLTVNTTSGDIEVKNSSLASVAVKSTSGELSFEGVIASTFDFYTVSGDVDLERSDANNVKIETTSGDVDCIFLTGKIYDYHTTSGRVNVPQSDSNGGACHIKTTSGDIKIRIN